MEGSAAVPSGGEDVVALEVRVAGRVQGVGFRYFAHDVARRLRIVGYVANQRDGSVRTYAEGPRGVLESFLQLMERGPSGAHVREVRSHWGPATGQYTCFRIERTA
jgi:acylphosphatase